MERKVKGRKEMKDREEHDGSGSDRGSSSGGVVMTVVVVVVEGK